MTTRRTTVADIKSNKPHLTGVEKHIQSPEVTCQIMSGWCGSSHPGAVDVTGAPNSFLQALRHPVECDSWIGCPTKLFFLSLYRRPFATLSRLQKNHRFSFRAL